MPVIPPYPALLCCLLLDLTFSADCCGLDRQCHADMTGLLQCRYVTPNEGKPSTVWFYITPLDQHTCRVFSHSVGCDPLPIPISWLLALRPRWLDHLVLNQVRTAAPPQDGNQCVRGSFERGLCVKLKRHTPSAQYWSHSKRIWTCLLLAAVAVEMYLYVVDCGLQR